MKRLLFTILFVTTVFFLAAQVVDVKNEPNHHNVFENEYVRILDVHIKPGDTSLFHKHSIPSVFLILSSVKSGSEVITENRNARRSGQGNMSYEDFTQGPRIHRVWNNDKDSEYHPVDIELLHNNPLKVDAGLRDDSLALVFDEAQVRAYRFTLAAQSQKNLQEAKVPILIVGLSDTAPGTEVNGKAFNKKGDFLFLPAGKIHSYKNLSNASIQFAVMELK